MNYLAIDTSGAHLTVLACKNGKVTAYYSDDCKLRHSAVMMDAVEDTLIKAGLDLNDADFFAACTGAGSFTGIRIGVSAVKALSYRYEKKVLAVTAFDILAYNIENGRVLAAIDAAHGNYYVCGYEDKKIILPPQFIDSAILKELSKEYKLISADLNGFDYQKADLVKGYINAIDGKAASVTDRENLIPLYIRKSQAEENR